MLLLVVVCPVDAKLFADMQGESLSQFGDLYQTELSSADKSDFIFEMPTIYVSDGDIYNSVKWFISIEEDGFYGYDHDSLEIDVNGKVAYYDIDGAIVSYGINLWAEDIYEPIAYVVVSSTYDMSPIIEAGAGRAPSISISDIQNDDAFSEIMQDGTISDIEMLYGGPFVYLAKVNLVASKDEESNFCLVDMLSQNVIDDGDIDISALKKPTPISSEALKNVQSWIDVSAFVDEMEESDDGAFADNELAESEQRQSVNGSYSSQMAFEYNEYLQSEDMEADLVTYEEKMAQSELPVCMSSVDTSTTLSSYLIAYGEGDAEIVIELLNGIGVDVVQEFESMDILRVGLTYEQSEAIKVEESVLMVVPDRLVNSDSYILEADNSFLGYNLDELPAISENYQDKVFLHEALTTISAESVINTGELPYNSKDAMRDAGYNSMVLAESEFYEDSMQTMAAFSTPSLIFTSVTASTATFSVTFPQSGAYGNYIEYYDPITEGHTTYADSYYMANGSYSITGLHPGSTYIVWLCWYTDASSAWSHRYNTYSVTIPYPSTQNLINNSGTYMSTSLESFDTPYFGNTSYITRWLGHLDNAYLKLQDLTGYTPYSGTKINILSDRNLTNYWATSGNPIKWGQSFVAKEAIKIKDYDDWSFGILHELGHDFDSNKWNWNSEFFANFKMCYLLEQLSGAKVEHHSQWFTGSSIQNFYYSVADDNYLKCISENYFHHDFLTYVFLRIKNSVGWQPFKETFRYFLQLPTNKVPSTNRDKFYLFIAKLGEYANCNIRSLFLSSEISIIQNYFGKTFPAYQDAQITSVIPTLMYAGRTYQVSVTVKNTGFASWTATKNYKLGAVGDSDPFAPGRITMPSGAHVDYLDIYTFQFTMSAPYSLNTYVTDWRMLQESVAWFGATTSKNVLVREPEYNPFDPNYSNYIGTYVGINFELSTIDIQYALGFIERNYGCGPSAGALLLWHLGQKRTDYSDLLMEITPPQLPNWQYNSPVDIAEVLITQPYMSSIFGTTVAEFLNGINAYMQVRGYSPQILHSYKGTGLGSGATTTDVQNVWNTIVNGIALKNAPVALGIGNTITGPSGNPDTNLSSMSYHWVAVSAYLECGPNAEFKFVKTKTWGEDKYASFTSLNLWRDSLAAIYVNVNY
jgi:hypothetical protein